MIDIETYSFTVFSLADLHLQLVARGDVGEKPDGFFVDFLFRVIEQRGEVREGVAVQDDLSLLIGSGYDVANGPQRSRLNFDLKMENRMEMRLEEGGKTTGESCETKSEA